MDSSDSDEILMADLVPQELAPPPMQLQAKTDNPTAWVGLAFSALGLLGAIIILLMLRNIHASASESNALLEIWESFTGLIVYCGGAIICGVFFIVGLTLCFTSLSKGIHIASVVGMGCCILNGACFLIFAWMAIG
ncbi:MAG: hypothetical protein AAF483_19010 [Planctomycetota bacterium]